MGSEMCIRDRAPVARLLTDDLKDFNFVEVILTNQDRSQISDVVVPDFLWINAQLKGLAPLYTHHRIEEGCDLGRPQPDFVCDELGTLKILPKHRLLELIKIGHF